jgi:hypothetical protein
LPNILKEADRLTSTDRHQDYGHPRDDFAKTAALFSALTGMEFPVEWVPLFMICVKLSREMHRHKDDNLIDLCGYARTLQLLFEPVDPDADVECGAGCDHA